MANPETFDQVQRNTVEENPWRSTLSLRPHRLYTEEFIAAFTRRPEKESTLARLGTWYQQYRYPEDTAEYMRDTFGSTNEQLTTNDKLVGEFLKTLSDLPDTAIIHLDLAKDAICDACPIGKHCLAANATFFGKNFDRRLRDGDALKKIHGALVDSGYEEGSDFVFRPTTHELLDYHGARLWSTDKATPETVVFNSMLVYTGPLRSILG